MVISVCIGSACHLSGSYNIIAIFQQKIEEYQLHDMVQVKAAFCMGQCGENGVCVKIDSGEIQCVTGSTARNFFDANVLATLKQSVSEHPAAQI
jgi:NADH:ubiquinone oxidoreductase subunit E